MSYRSETIAEVLPRINITYFLPALQREFVWTAEQVCSLFDSLMRKYPISSFLFWQVPPESRDDVEAYEFLYTVQESRNRARPAKVHSNKELTFVLDGQQRLTSILVGLQGMYHGRKTRSGKGSKTHVAKKLFLDLLHDGRVPDGEGETYYNFDFFEYAPSLLQKTAFWFEVKRILTLSADGIDGLIERQTKTIKDIRSLTSQQGQIVAHNLRGLYEAVSVDEAISYHAEVDPDHERILEIFVRANSGGTVLSKSDLLLSTLTLHWGTENAREEINQFVDHLNTTLTRKNRLNKDFVMKACLVLLDLPVAYRVTSFNRDTCARIRDRWEDIKRTLTAAVDAANTWGIDEETLTSANALIPIAYYLYRHPNISLRGESAAEVENASKARVWLLSALLNRVFSGSTDSRLTKLREVFQLHWKPNAEFPITQLDEAVRNAGWASATGQEAIDNILDLSYGDPNCFLALSLLYDDRNWGTMSFSIDHLFSKDSFKKGTSDQVKELRDVFSNLALVIATENSGKSSRSLKEWLQTRSPEYLKRHLIPLDPDLWQIDQFENFIVERQKLLRDRLRLVLSVNLADDVNSA